MTNKPESAAAEAVVWMCRFQDTKQIWIDEVCVWTTEAEAVQCAADMNEEIESANFEAVKLCDASALDALRGEVVELQQSLDRLSGMKFSDRMHAALVSRADAAERRVAELESALKGLLDDTQHKDHNCGDEEWCPVIHARAALTKESP